MNIPAEQTTFTRKYKVVSGSISRREGAKGLLRTYFKGDAIELTEAQAKKYGAQVRDSHLPVMAEGEDIVARDNRDAERLRAKRSGEKVQPRSKPLVSNDEVTDEDDNSDPNKNADDENDPDTANKVPPVVDTTVHKTQTPPAATAQRGVHRNNNNGRK